MKRVLLDVDGVLRNFVKGAIRVVNTLPGRQHDVEDVMGWDIASSLDLTRDERKAMYAGINASGFAAGLDPYPGSAEFVRRLMMAHDVYFVTSPWNTNPTWTSETEAWLVRHFGVSFQRVIHVPSGLKKLVHGDVLVDDKVSTVREWVDERPVEPTEGRTVVRVLGAGILWRNHHNSHEAWNGWWSSDYDQLVGLIGSLP